MGFGRPRGGATPEALEHLYRTQFRAFLRVAASIAGERHAADAVHNAFVRVLRHRESFREGRSLEAWVWRTVVNAARDVRRAHRDEFALDDLHEPTSNGRRTAPFSTTTRERTPSTPRRRTPSLTRRRPSPSTRACASACSTSCTQAKRARTDASSSADETRSASCPLTAT
ncbi:MAG: RNA polymerase sigma factor [Gaiellales bacterium]